MNKADLYIIHKKEVVIHGDYISLSKSNFNPMSIENSENGFHPLNPNFEVIRVPVHAVANDGKKRLIAIEPEIKHLIEQPLLEELSFQKRYSDRVRNNSDTLSRRIDQFNCMNKWQKIKFILKGGWV